MALALLASAGPAAAQDRHGSWYLLGGFVIAHQDGAQDDETQTYVTAPGGTSAGWLVAVGVSAGPYIGIEGELGSTGTLRAREPSRYGMTFNEERRDLLLSANLRLHARPGRRVDLEPVAGLGVVWHRGSTQIDYDRPWLPPGPSVEHGPRIDYRAATSMSVLAGADLRLGGRRMAAVPSFRVRWAPKSQELDSRYPGGYAQWTVVVGAHARLDF